MNLCSINKNRILEFVSTLQQRDESLFEDEGEFVVESKDGRHQFRVRMFTINLDGNFIGGFGATTWTAALNEMFKTNLDKENKGD